MIPSITILYGEPGTIKTSLAITWPTPIAFYNLEGGANRAWEYDNMKAAGQIVERKFTVPPHSMVARYEQLAGHSEVWAAFTQKTMEDLRDFPTVVWDTGTVVWAMARDAYLQEIQITNPGRKQLQQIEYGEPNRRMFELFNVARAYGKNLVITHHETPIYETAIDQLGRPMVDENDNVISFDSGKKTAEGFKHTIGLGDWVLRSDFRPNEATPFVKVEKSGYGLHLKNEEIEWPTYYKIEQLVATPEAE